MGIFTKAPVSVVVTDRDGYDGATIAVNPAESGAAHYNTTQVSVGNTATQLLTTNATRRAALITNPSTTVTVYVGSAAVTTSTGLPVGPGLSLTLPTVGAIYGIVSSSTQTVGVIETYD